MNLIDFHEIVNYRITEGAEFQWSCFGRNAFCLDSEIAGQCNVSVIFDTLTQEVYETTAYDYVRSRAYRWQNPKFREAYNAEATSRKVDGDQAWDNVKFIDLDVAKDFIEKATAIFDGDEYDTRVQIELEVDTDVLFRVMKEAHERDITTNELVNRVLRSAIGDNQ